MEGRGGRVSRSAGCDGGGGEEVEGEVEREWMIARKTLRTATYIGLRSHQCALVSELLSSERSFSVWDEQQAKISTTIPCGQAKIFNWAQCVRLKLSHGSLRQNLSSGIL